MGSSRAGRRPRRGTRMPATAITAAVEELVFLMLLADGNASKGVQQAVGLLKDSDETVKVMRQAMWMREQAETALRKGGAGVEVQQLDTYKYITANYWELVESWKTLVENS